MSRVRCLCGGKLTGTDHIDASNFGFIPFSALAVRGYECAFDDGIYLPGGRIFEQCDQCGSLILCEYPGLTNSDRVSDTSNPFGPGTCFEQCDVNTLPAAYQSYRAMIESGVSCGIMYIGGFRQLVAHMFDTDDEHMPSWLQVKNMVLDMPTNLLDEWWMAALGRNYIVLYDSVRQLHAVAAWHRIAGTEPDNPEFTDQQDQFEFDFDGTTADASRTSNAADAFAATDTADVTDNVDETGQRSQFSQAFHAGQSDQSGQSGQARQLGPFGQYYSQPAQSAQPESFDFVSYPREIESDAVDIELPMRRRKQLSTGNRARYELANHGIRIMRPLKEVGQWAPNDLIADSSEYLKRHHVHDLFDAGFGVWHSTVHCDNEGKDFTVDALVRGHDVISVQCTCTTAKQHRVCKHVGAVVLELCQRYHIRPEIPVVQSVPWSRTSQFVHQYKSATPRRFSHYAPAEHVLQSESSPKKRYAWISEYLDMFLHPKQPFYTIAFLPIDHADTRKIGYCVYSPDVRAFIDAVMQHDQADYIDVIRHYGLNPDVSFHMLNIDEMDGQLVYALLVMIVHREGLHEGLIAECMNDGTIVQLLTRLQELSE